MEDKTNNAKECPVGCICKGSIGEVIMLSGFVDKCVHTRKIEKHCEPNVIFNPDSSTSINAKKNTYPSLIQNLEDKDKAAYVDVLPLKVR